MIEDAFAKTPSAIYDANSAIEKKNRTVTVSFRLPKNMVDELMEEVERSGSSPSAILRKVLEKYLDWDRYRLQMNMIPFPDVFVDESLKRLSRKDIGDIASQFANAFSGLVLLKMGKMDLESTLKMMEEWFRDGAINYRRGYADNCHVFVIQHGLDVNWSLYLAHFFTTLCGDLDVYCKVELNQDGKTLLLFARDDRAGASRASDRTTPPDRRAYAELGNTRKGAKHGRKGSEERDQP
ncbi:MAG TPA: ribbon-helix-helix domain-containing protein [Nitrososphaera sp.]|jgi:hypothetical protein